MEVRKNWCSGGKKTLNIMKIHDPVFKPLVRCQLKHEATDAEDNTAAPFGQHQPVSFGTRDPGSKKRFAPGLKPARESGLRNS